MLQSEFLAGAMSHAYIPLYAYFLLRDFELPVLAFHKVGLVQQSNQISHHCLQLQEALALLMTNSCVSPHP